MNQTRKITTETWVRDLGEAEGGLYPTQATFYPHKGEFYPPHLGILREKEMLELVDFLLECLETFPVAIKTGDYVRFRDGGATICRVENIDSNFEGAGPAVAVYWPDTHSIEWFNANKLEKVYMFHTERTTYDRPD